MRMTVGAEAPDFTLKEPEGGDVTLSDFRGKQNVVLVFFPFAFSRVCRGELCQLREELTVFQSANAQLLAISCDSRFTQGRWATEQQITFPLLADFWPHGEVSRRYSVFNETRGCPNRATFVINTEGRIADAFDTPDLLVPRERAAYEAALAKLD